MIQSTFVLLKGIGPSSERRLWDAGIRDWQAFLTSSTIPGIGPDRKTLYDLGLKEAMSQLDARQSRYFSRCLKARDHWRLFDTFRSGALYVDIETTGGSPGEGAVTVVGLYRPGTMISLVLGDTLTEARLQEEFSRADLLVTFFGSVFDLPYLRATFPSLRLDHPHFDLCFTARRLGLQGGLKRIEQATGLSRAADLQGLDGWDAVRLWRRWLAGDAPSLETLIRYNECDTRNLEALAQIMFSCMLERYGPRHADGACPQGPQGAHGFV